MPKNPDFLNFLGFSSRSVWLTSVMELILFRFLALYKGNFLRKYLRIWHHLKLGPFLRSMKRCLKFLNCPIFRHFQGPVLIYFKSWPISIFSYFIYEWTEMPIRRQIPKCDFCHHSGYIYGAYFKNFPHFSFWVFFEGIKMPKIFHLPFFAFWRQRLWLFGPFLRDQKCLRF